MIFYDMELTGITMELPVVGQNSSIRRTLKNKIWSEGEVMDTMFDAMEEVGKHWDALEDKPEDLKAFVLADESIKKAFTQLDKLGYIVEEDLEDKDILVYIDIENIKEENKAQIEKQRKYSRTERPEFIQVENYIRDLIGKGKIDKAAGYIEGLNLANYIDETEYIKLCKKINAKL